MQAFWKECCDEGGLAWDDTNNNRAFHAGELSATLNGASIYIVAKRQKDKIKDDKGEPMWTGHRPRAAPRRARRVLSPLPQPVARGHEVRQEPEAREGLPPLAPQGRELRQVVHHPGGLHRSAPPRSGRTTPCGASSTSRSKMFRTAARNTRLFGYAGPSTAKATEGFTKYVITDMYAKAVQGMKAEDAVKWAEGELKKIYEA